MEQLIDKCKAMGIELNEKQIEQFKVYYDMLIEKNKVMNLTTITELSEVIDKHFVDSLSIVKAISLKDNLKILDLGTGAGFPGIPLKIVFPHLDITLLDSLNKKIKFLDEVIEELNLEGIQAIHGRAEDFARQSGYREAFDVCLSRAVANLSTLTEYCLPYVVIGGQFVPYKSGVIDNEVIESKTAVFQLGGKVKEVVKFTLPETEIERSFVIIDKTKKTPKMYPRKAGLPSKEPIKN